MTVQAHLPCEVFPSGSHAEADSLCSGRSSGQRIEDIGLYKRKDLVRPSNLKAVFRDIRNHLAGMTTGITRDEALAQEIINLLFCKLLDEQESGAEDTVNFRAGVDELTKTFKPVSVRSLNR